MPSVPVSPWQTLPTGTITFLFTDIEGSTQLWEQQRPTMSIALARHETLMQEAIIAQEGHVFKTIGDALCAAFWTAPQALQAALSAQQAILAEPWPETVLLRVRIALHTGTAEERNSDYFGPPLNRVARLLGTGHGGQTLLSQATYELACDFLPPDCSLLDLGTHTLRDLGRPEQIYQLLHPNLPAQFPALKSLDSLPNNLPQQITSFVGREHELAQIKTLLSQHRLLTLTGSGGTGKTRLSLQTGADVLDQYPDGVWLVELAPIIESGLIPQAIAGVLGVKEQGGQTLTQSLAEYLKRKHLLLILDNCEQLASACAQLASTLLNACPHLQILATSQHVLNILGSAKFAVPPLAQPPADKMFTPTELTQFAAADLFVARAKSVSPSFDLLESETKAVAQVCRRLAGLPLAIELAAAWADVLSPQKIAERINQRFLKLQRGHTTSPMRHQTLIAAMDYSYELLEESERQVLARLSVFSGGWTLEAAEEICADPDANPGEVLTILSHLVDKSLVTVEDRDGERRYDFLETIRQYATDGLDAYGETEVMQQRHRDWFIALAEQLEPELTRAHQRETLALMAQENDNFRAVFDRLPDSNFSPETVSDGLRLAAALARFWHIHGHFAEGRARLRIVLGRAVDSAPTPALAKAFAGAGFLARAQGDYPEAEAMLARSLALWKTLDDPSGLAFALNNQGLVAHDLGRYEEAMALQEESLALRRGLGDTWGIAASLNNLGNTALALGNTKKAQELYEESLALRRTLNDAHGIATSLLNLGTIVWMQKDYETALQIWIQCHDIFQELSDQTGRVSVLYNLGSVARNLGDRVLARSYFLDSLRVSLMIGAEEGITLAIENLAILVCQKEDFRLAVRLWGGAAKMRKSLGIPMPEPDWAEQKPEQEKAHAILGTADFAAAWDDGQNLTRTEFLNLVLDDRLKEDIL